MGQEIKGKIAYITGAGSGIGKATVLQLAKEGVHVGLIGRTKSKLEQVAEEVKSNGVHVVVAPADIAKMDEVNQAVEKLKQELGTADIGHNNLIVRMS